MKNIILAWLLIPQLVFGQAIYSGENVKILKDRLDINGKAKVMSGTADPTSSATSAPIGTIYLNSSNGNLYRKKDAGSSTNWEQIGPDTNISPIKNPDLEVASTGWSTYNDSASRPEDSANGATGGSPCASYTAARSTSSPISGVGSLLISKPASNCQGTGVSYDFTIPTKWKTKVLTIEADYTISSGTYSPGTSTTDSDQIVYIVDVTNGKRIEPINFKVDGTGTTNQYHFTSQFQATDSASYRLAIHTATSTSVAYDIKWDDFDLSLKPGSKGTVVTDWTAWTPTGTLTTNVTYTGFYRRVGDTAEFDVTIAFGGANTQGVPLVNLPLTIDTAKISSTGSANTTFGKVTLRDDTGAYYPGVVAYESTTSVRLYIFSDDGGAGSTYLDHSNLNTSGNIPITYAINDRIHARFSFPILGWSATGNVSNDDGREVVASYHTTAGTALTSNTTNIDYTTKIKDTHSAWSGTVFTAPMTRTYIACASVHLTGSVASSIVLFKNGSTYATLGQDTSSDQKNGCMSLPLVAGDTLSFRLNNNATTNGTTTTTMSIVSTGGSSFVSPSETVAFYYRGQPTGTLNSSFNTATFATKVKDTHGMCSSGTCTVPMSGTYSINCQTLVLGTFAANSNAEIGIFVNGSQISFGEERPGASSGAASAETNIVGYPLNAGDALTCRVSTDATGPSYHSTATWHHFAAVRTGP